MRLAPAPAAASAADVSDLLPAVSPPGANDFTCKPTKAQPAPVVLVHGTFEGAADNWVTASPKFKAAGYCVFALEYGNRGTGDIAASAGQLQRFVDAVLGATGARKVSMVGHSQGGMMPRYYLKFLGGASKVDDLVGLAPSNHGTDKPRRPRRGRDLLPRVRPAARRLALPHEPQRGRRDPGAVSYTQIETRYDEVVTPYTSAFLAPGPRTANILLQDACPAEVIDHHEMPNDGLGSAGPCRRSGARPRGPDAPAELHLARRWTKPAGWCARGARCAVVLPHGAGRCVGDRVLAHGVDPVQAADRHTAGEPEHRSHHEARSAESDALGIRCSGARSPSPHPDAHPAPRLAMHRISLVFSWLPGHVGGR